MSLLEVQNLSVSFRTSKGTVDVLKNIQFQLEEGESLGFVGESGSGKSVTSLAILDLLASNSVIDSGKILFQNKNIFQMSETEKQKIRGAQISMIFQDPMSSLDPCYTVFDQIAEALQIHENLSKQQIKDRVLLLLGKVGIPDPVSRLNAYPHELSGGMSQRVMIAMAIACRPKILIADEPTTALDVTVQAQILKLIQDLKKETGMSLILVSHDLGVVSQNTEKLIVMYAGEIVEIGPSKEILQSPSHPYTLGLLNSLPARHLHQSESFRLPSIHGVVPDLRQRPQGCPFSPRCSLATAACQGSIEVIQRSGRMIRCLYPQ